MARLLALSSLLVVALVTAKEESEIACQTNVMGQLDHYLKEIEVLPNANGNIKQKFPETIGKLKEACKMNKKAVGILTKLADKCMSGFKKNVMQVTLYSVKKSQKALCRPKPTKEMRDFVAAGKCVNSGQERFRRCIQQTAMNIFKVKFIEDNLKVPLICCEIVRARQCLMKEAKKVKECKDEHVETINNRFNTVSMNSMNIACGQYTDESDRCDRVQPPQGVHLDRGNKSLVMTMFDLLDSLPLNEDSFPGSSR